MQGVDPAEHVDLAGLAWGDDDRAVGFDHARRGEPRMPAEQQPPRRGVVGVLDQFLEHREPVVVAVPQVVGDLRLEAIVGDLFAR
ncbi:MAG: hypothetical protein EA400_13180 [Chromatiaceae bacterium]|nr:MAG: hypothetical protein EA400_13180 [Chromatiaceae bacterium]